ncbi:MAG TPA: AMP-binding protein [Solirubrobacteraceae bacterium]|jgi:fatty-acyl-CoA synthase|nr:AMP-binding protein [Solirubrobacteraceae bacterium]
MRPDRSLRAVSIARRWGLTPAGAYALAALRWPDRLAIIDERGPLTFAEVDRRTGSLARAFDAAGVDRSATVAIMCRNHRGLVESVVAASKLGADLLLLDAGGDPEAIAEAVDRAAPAALVYDEEFGGALPASRRAPAHFIAWPEPDRPCGHPRLEDLIAREDALAPWPPRARHPGTVTLAPGTPGDRVGPALPCSLEIPGAVISQIPLRASEPTVIAAPMSGTWGYLHLMLAMRLASTLILRRRFDPLEALVAADEHRATALALLPEMLAEIVRLPAVTVRCYARDALRVLAVQGAELDSDLAIPAMEVFGDVLYNLYGPSIVRLTASWASSVSMSESAPVGQLALT